MSRLNDLMENYHIPLGLLITATKEVGDNQDKIADYLEEYISVYGLEKRGDGMAIVLTNGELFVSRKKTGGVIKVKDISQAQDFHTMERALNQIKKAPGKCKSYYPVDTSVTEIVVASETEKIINVGNKKKIKRKRYSAEQRKIIYQRANGRCKLCGRKIELDNFSLDHVIPLSMGGADSMTNLQATCRGCNFQKSYFLPDQFFDRISEIFVYQMEERYGRKDDWKAVHNLLMEIL